MKRFRFRLARLERLRQTQRREAQVALLATLETVARCTKRREALELAIRDAEKRGIPSSSGSEVRQMAVYLQSLRNVTADAATREIEAVRAAREAEHRYTEAARDHRVLEKLRERRWRRWLDGITRDEQKILDEVHLVRVARDQAGMSRQGQES